MKMQICTIQNRFDTFTYRTVRSCENVPAVHVAHEVKNDFTGQFDTVIDTMAFLM